MNNKTASAAERFKPPVISALVEAARMGKARSFAGLRPGEKTAAFILAGQSLAGGSSEGLYVPANAGKVDNLDQYTGAIFAGLDPLIGGALSATPSRQGTTFTRVADQLISDAVFDRVVLIPASIGATNINQWNDTLYTEIINAYIRASAISLPVTAVLWQQGETGSASNSQSFYESNFRGMKQKVEAAGCKAPWILAKSTYVPGGGLGQGTRAAIDAMINGNDLLSGPDIDTLGSAYRSVVDDQHLNSVGNASAASLWTQSIKSALPRLIV